MCALMYGLILRRMIFPLNMLRNLFSKWSSYMHAWTRIWAAPLTQLNGKEVPCN